MTASARSSKRSTAGRRAARLEYATIAWNVMEVFVTVALGLLAGSLALIAFGLDSVGELLASGAVLWDLRGEPEDRRRQRALWLVALSFFFIAAVLLAGGIHNLVVEHHPDDSPLGIVYLVVAASAMFALAFKKRALSAEIDSHALVHEARVTFLDGALATGVLLALVANTALDWWWADAAATIGIAIMAIGEGVIAPRRHA